MDRLSHFFTYKRFPLTNLIYVLLVIHFAIPAVGAFYEFIAGRHGFLSGLAECSQQVHG